MKTKVKIPQHSEEALRVLQDHGIFIYDYADFEDDHIVCYQRWGRGFRKDIFRECENDG